MYPFRVLQHMVQAGQMTPAFQQFPQAALEEYQQATVTPVSQPPGTAVTVTTDPSAQPQTAYSPTTVATAGAVEQQTVSVRLFYFIFLHYKIKLMIKIES